MHRFFILMLVCCVLILPVAGMAGLAQAEEPSLTASYGDQSLSGSTSWQGRIMVNGLLRVPAAARLTIAPGTIIEFGRLDVNGDGIGESGIQFQGQLIVQGTPENPVIFRSAGDKPGPGDWKGLSFLGDDREESVIDHCRIEHASRGISINFARVAVNNSVIVNNLRGIQFQAAKLSIRHSLLRQNESGLWGRTSQLVLTNNEISRNLIGVTLVEVDLEASANRFVNNRLGGLEISGGSVSFRKNLVAGNWLGITAGGGVRGDFAGNVLNGNLKAAFKITKAGSIRITGNAITGNDLDGIIIKDSQVEITDNLIALNGGKGLVLTGFDGRILDNNILENTTCALEVKQNGNLNLQGNWWGRSEPVIVEYRDDDDPGELEIKPSLEEARSFVWPRAVIDADITWLGKVKVRNFLEVRPGSSLRLMPGTIAEFAGRESGLLVQGRLLARGTDRKRIIFKAADSEKSGSWAGVQLEKAVHSKVSYCTFREAQWGLHIHFVPITISDCRFINNDIGLKFRGGPMQLRRSVITGNRIGFRSFWGEIEVFQNEIFNNEIGIFIRDGGGKIRIFNNNLRNNNRYNLRLGDFNQQDVDAPANWWGTTQPDETIFDRQEESFIGRVNSDSPLSAPVRIAPAILPLPVSAAARPEDSRIFKSQE